MPSGFKEAHFPLAIATAVTERLFDAVDLVKLLIESEFTKAA